MNRQWGAILLVAGTCLGSGMVALPIVLSKLGVYIGVAAMVFMWAIMYGAALVTVELNLQAKRSMPLGQLGKHFSGETAKFLGILSIKLLSYALLSAFLYGISSILHELLPQHTQTTILIWCSLCAFLVLSTHMPLIDFLNRMLFHSLLVGLGALILFLWIKLPGVSHLPLVPIACTQGSWTGILPVIFTAFGFHGMIHALTDYCENDAIVLKRAFFWGSLIPAVIYILWTVGVLGTIYGADRAFYDTMAYKGVEVGDLVRELTDLSHTPWLKTIIWAGMVLKFALSIIGVGLSLREALKPLCQKHVPQPVLSALCIGPPMLVAYFIPNAFIAVLGFAGMILVIIALFLPLYLLYFAKKPFNFSLLNRPWILGILWAVGGITIVAEMVHTLYK